MTDATPTIGQALEALSQLSHVLCGTCVCDRCRIRSDAKATIRATLEAAHEEAAAWETIERWRNRDQNTAAIVIGLGREAKAIPNTFVGVDRETFLEALQAAAAYVKEQEQHG